MRIREMPKDGGAHSPDDRQQAKKARWVLKILVFRGAMAAD